MTDPKDQIAEPKDFSISPRVFSMHPDLHTARQRIHDRKLSAVDSMKRCIEHAKSPSCQSAFVSTRFERALDESRSADPQPGRAGWAPLAGLACSVKDLFDVAGEVTCAGSTVLADRPAATADCTAVARLRAAGASIIGRTHMVEFAFSGVGTNPHFPTPAAWDGRFNHPIGDGAQARVPGGSSSGAAVSVATGAAFIGLGSDTGGSIRIPAALNGIVGFKNTAALVPTTGAFPLSTTLDTVCALTRSVRDAVLAHEILSARPVVRSQAPLRHFRLAVARTVMLDNMDSNVAHAFERTLRTLRDGGAEVVEIDLDEIRNLGAIQSTGGFAAAEAYATHRNLLEQHAGNYDPRVSQRIQRGAIMKAHEYIELTRERSRWIDSVERALTGFDAVLSPTVPIVAPLLGDVAPADGANPMQDKRRDDAFFRANALLLRNTSVVNMLDGCALSLPCHQFGELPVGLMLWHGAHRDNAVLNLGLQVEKILTKE